MAGFEVEIKLGDRLVGYLHHSSNELVSDFRYSDEWRIAGFPLSPALPLDGSFSCEAVLAFFENLLPEGEAFEWLQKKMRLPKCAVFELGLAMPDDRAGAVRIVHDALTSPPTEFREIPQHELIARIKSMQETPIAVWDNRMRIAIAGAQPKITVLKIRDKIGFSASKDLCSDRILKFEDGRHRHLILNEYLTLSLARKAGFPVVEANLLNLAGHRALEVIRFDRMVVETPEGVRVKRRHVIDACQALGMLSHE